MPQLHETMYGRKLLEHDIPEISRQLKRIADLLEKTLEKSENKSKTKKNTDILSYFLLFINFL